MLIPSKIALIERVVMVAEAMTPDNQFHDLRAARINRRNLGIRRLSADGVFVHKTGSTVELQSLISDTLL